MTIFQKEINTDTKTETQDIFAAVRRPLSENEMKMITGGSNGGTSGPYLMNIEDYHFTNAEGESLTHGDIARSGHIDVYSAGDGDDQIVSDKLGYISHGKFYLEIGAIQGAHTDQYYDPILVHYDGHGNGNGNGNGNAATSEDDFREALSTELSPELYAEVISKTKYN